MLKKMFIFRAVEKRILEQRCIRNVDLDFDAKLMAFCKVSFQRKLNLELKPTRISF